MTLPEPYLEAEQVRTFLGEPAALAGIREFVFENGPAEGVHAAEVYNGRGLNFTLMKSRCLDIADASYKGIPLAWRGAPGITFPTQAYYQDADFLWGFHGGLLLTGGLTYVGEPTVDQGERLGLHGRAYQLRARVETVRRAWEGDDYVLEVAGQVNESRVFGPDMTLQRKIRTTHRMAGFELTDRVVNRLDVPSPHALLYHITFGYPLIAPGAEIVYSAEGYEEWAGSVRQPDHPEFNIVQPPLDAHRGASEDFTHILPHADDQGLVHAAIINEELELGVMIKYPREQMPRLGLWMHYGGGGKYAVAYEPMTGFVEGRARDREEGALIEMAPGEAREYRLSVHIIEGRESLAALKRQIQEMG